MERLVVALAGISLLTVRALCAVTTTWDGTDGLWNDPGKWDEGVPGAGDTAIINGGSVLIAESSSELAQLTLNGGTLTFTNWSTRLSADVIEILGSSKVTLPPPFRDDQMSNRVWFACGTFELGENAEIDASEKGYQRGSTVSEASYGPGAIAGGNNPAPAASHGGHGAGRLADSVYGAAEAPLYPGSGGSKSSWDYGGHGGGAVRIEATDTVVIDGTISANAGNGLVRSGGGSGGSIYITCRTISGGGLLSAAGGQSNYSDNGLGGGGGRIAVVYNTTDQAALPVPGLRFWVHAGTVITEGEPGTLYFPDTRFLETDVWTHRGKWVNDGLTAYARDTLTIDQGWLCFPNDGFTLTVTNGLTLAGDGSIAPTYGWRYYNAGRLELFGGRLIVGGDLVASNTASCSMLSGTNTSDVSVGGDLLMSQEARATFHASPTNGIAPEYGARLSVTGLLAITTGSWLIPVSDWTNGGSVFMWAGSVSLGEGSGIDADRRGWGNNPKTYDVGLNYGPGRGGYSMGGAGYGGRGGTTLGGQPYGSPQDPREPGSAGADQAANGGYGGGLVRLTVDGGVTINGTITANGQDGGINSGRRGGGGSGGGVYISCAWIAGTNGTVMADGGLGHNSTYAAGGGGGGRIAVHYSPAQQDAIPLPSLQFSARGGRGTGDTFLNRDDIDGDLGTLYFTDSRFLAEPINHSGVWLAPGLTNLNVAQLDVTDRWIRFPNPGYAITVDGDVKIADNGRLDLVNGTLVCGGDMTLTNRGTLAFLSENRDDPVNALDVQGDLALWNKSYLTVHAAPTNAVSGYGARIDVGGTLRVDENCWVWPFSNPTNTGSARFAVDQLIIATNAGFNATGRGAAGAPPTVTPGYGIGGGLSGTIRGGGGYGGIGGVPGNNGGIAYGSKERPTDAGSGGAGTTSGLSPGGAGGGLIWIHVQRHADINGQLLANGSNPGIYSGGGSGGGIYLRCIRLSGAFHLTAFGGNGGTHSLHGGGSGASGRIAIWRALDESTFTSNILAGTSPLNRVGEDGTFYMGEVALPGTLLLLR